jgi:DNA-binding PadR family transcriptional regulator
MREKTDVWQGTLALMALRTLETLGPQHGYGLARRIEQTSGNLLQLNYGTLYPALLNWSRRATSVRVGASLTTTGAPSITS